MRLCLAVDRCSKGAEEVLLERRLQGTVGCCRSLAHSSMCVILSLAFSPEFRSI